MRIDIVYRRIFTKFSRNWIDTVVHLNKETKVFHQVWLSRWYNRSAIKDFNHDWRFSWCRINRKTCLLFHFDEFVLRFVRIIVFSRRKLFFLFRFIDIEEWIRIGNVNKINYSLQLTLIVSLIFYICYS